jgi:hypothetical protein
MSTVASPLSRTAASAAISAALIFIVLALLLDAPLWLVSLVPTQDGPVHLAQADLIARSGWGGALSDPAAIFYQWNPRIEPNTAIYLLLAGLIRLTGNPLVANAIFLTLYGIVWVAAAFAIAHVESKRPVIAVLLLLPLAFGRFIHLGFYNYALGIPLFLLFAAFWRSLAGRRDVAAFVATGIFLLVLCMTHLTAAVAAFLFLAADGAARALDAYDRSGTRGAARGLALDGAWALAAALPALVLIVSFTLAYRDIPGDVPGRLHIIPKLAGASYLYSFTWWEVVALVPLLGAVVFAAIGAVRRITSGDRVWPIFLVLVLILAFLNLGTGAASMSERLPPLTWIAVILIIAGRQMDDAVARGLALAAIIGLIGQTAIRTAAYKSWAPTMEAILAAGRDRPEQTFVNVDLTPLQSSAFAWHTIPTLHADQIAALASRGVGLSTALPSTRYFGYFPLQYVAANDFMRAGRDWVAAPEASTLAAVRHDHHGAPDVLIVTAVDAAGPKLAAELSGNGCNTSHIGKRWLTVCAAGPQSR